MAVTAGNFPQDKHTLFFKKDCPPRKQKLESDTNLNLLSSEPDMTNEAVVYETVLNGHY